MWPASSTVCNSVTYSYTVRLFYYFWRHRSARIRRELVVRWMKLVEMKLDEPVVMSFKLLICLESESASFYLFPLFWPTFLLEMLTEHYSVHIKQNSVIALIMWCITVTCTRCAHRTILPHSRLSFTFSFRPFCSLIILQLAAMIISYFLIEFSPLLFLPTWLMAFFSLAPFRWFPFVGFLSLVSFRWFPFVGFLSLVVFR